MLKRPKPGDDEGDILRMQEEYLKEKDKNKSFEPAAKVVNLRTEPTELPKSDTRKPSQYALKKGLQTKVTKTVRFVNPSTSMVGDIIEKNLVASTNRDKEDENEDKVHHPSIIHSILGSIVEKTIDTETQPNIWPMPTQGFPDVHKHEHYENNGSKSIFSQHMSKLRQEKNIVDSMTMEVDDKSPDNISVKHNKHEISSVNLPNKSYILTCEESDVIHKENSVKLSSMSEHEILEEQNKLMSSLSPEVIAFLKSKRKNEQKNLNSVSDINAVQLMDTSETFQEPHTDDSLWDNDVLSHPGSHTWLNFNTYEKDKLAWIKDIEVLSTKPNEPHEARFDFKGYLLPFTMEYTEETKTLFHHGEEPNRPGYSLSEFIQLSRSSVTQQRVMALNALGGILEYYMTGMYKNIVEIPLSKLLFIIRFALDENKIIVLEPALKAMRNLLYNRVDEAALDGLIGTELGMLQPSLENDKSEIHELDSKEAELKDFHLAEIDLITAVIRTDIIQRLQYILSSIKPGYSSVQFCLQIIIRLIRDSIDTAQKILDSEYLMSTIFTNFIPPTSINFAFSPEIVYKGKPLLVALKFVRVLSLQSEIFSKVLVDKYYILKPISQYISSEVEGTYGLRIQIETLCILSNLVYYDVATAEVVSLLPLIVLMLYKHVYGTDVTNESSVLSSIHAASILQLVNKLLKLNIPSINQIRLQLVDLVMKGMKKWLAQIGNTCTCAHINLVSAVLDCCRTIIQENYELNSLNESLFLFNSSHGYNFMVEKLLQTSNLLSGMDDNNLHIDKNIMSLGTCMVNCSQPVLPILNKSSPIIFLSSLFKVVDCVKKPDLAKNFVQKLHNYLQKIRNVTPFLCSNWFTRTEVDFIFRIIKIAKVEPSIDETQKDVIYVIANKLCYILRIDKALELDFLFNEIVFNNDWFTAERIMKLVSISDSIFSLSLLDIEEIKKSYKKVINVSYKDVEQNVVLRGWQEPILPRDWIYLPILNLYTKSQELTSPLLPNDNINELGKLISLEKELVLNSNLQWIIFNEICFPDLLTDINITDRFCRIMCIFLCDNSLFLEPKINGLLKHCILILFKKEKKSCFNFDKSLVGLHNFQDFYTQFLEQFQSVSYGNVNFAACVLVPLAQRHNVKWRKLVWSEYAGCLRALDCPEQLLCYDIESYLYPEETDESLIKSYLVALSGNLLRSGTLAHKIASHHVESFKNRSKTVI